MFIDEGSKQATEHVLSDRCRRSQRQLSGDLPPAPPSSRSASETIEPHFTLFVLLAVADRLIGSIATDFEQFMPRGWSFAARAIVGEVWRR
jgi:hypothetical protein